MARNIAFDDFFLRLIENSFENVEFIERLFSEPDVSRFFVLRDEHSTNIPLFVRYMALMNKQNYALNYIIEAKDHTPVGIITAELFQDNNKQVMWQVAIAIASNFRRQGFAKKATLGLEQVLKNFAIDNVMLDISDDNKASEAVATLCGYSPMKSGTGGYIGFFDYDNNGDIRMRKHWMKNLRQSNPRDEAAKKGIAAYQAKQFRSAIRFYLAALDKEAVPGCLFNDGQLYSNLGMAYSASGEYVEAHKCLKKAWALGCQNDAVKTELKWLRDNVGLF